MPPIAAMPGNSNCAGERNSPTNNSRFNSRPTRKKKTAIRPSLIQSSSGFSSCKLPSRMSSSTCSSPLYSDCSGELLISSASAAAATSNKPDAASKAKNWRMTRNGMIHPYQRKTVG